jgi:hypothetical protein
MGTRSDPLLEGTAPAPDGGVADPYEKRIEARIGFALAIHGERIDTEHARDFALGDHVVV